MLLNDLTIDIEALGHILGRTPKTIRTQMYRCRHALPAPLRLPGTRQMLWRRSDVEKWLQAQPVRWPDPSAEQETPTESDAAVSAPRGRRRRVVEGGV